MSHTFTQLTVHSVFSTKGRRDQIPESRRPRIDGFMAAMINREFGFAREVGGTANHTHVLFDLSPSVALADCMRELKCVSSGWVHNTFPEMGEFNWQPGYGAFSVSGSAIPEVKEYVRNQARRHRGGSFEEEFQLLLEKHGIAYDARHLWA
jgi:REP element-mobilizing transposase RayT